MSNYDLQHIKAVQSDFNSRKSAAEKAFKSQLKLKIKADKKAGISQDQSINNIAASLVDTLDSPAPIQQTQEQPTQQTQTLPQIQPRTTQDVAQQMDIAEQLRDNKQRTAEESAKRIDELNNQLTANKEFMQKASGLLDKRDADYTNLTGKTDYNDAAQALYNSTFSPKNETLDNTPTSTQQTVETPKKVASTQKSVSVSNTKEVDAKKKAYEDAVKKQKEAQTVAEKNREEKLNTLLKARDKAKNSQQIDAINSQINAIKDNRTVKTSAELQAKKKAEEAKKAYEEAKKKAGNSDILLSKVTADKKQKEQTALAKAKSDLGDMRTKVLANDPEQMQTVQTNNALARTDAEYEEAKKNKPTLTETFKVANMPAGAEKKKAEAELEARRKAAEPKTVQEERANDKAFLDKYPALSPLVGSIDTLASVPTAALNALAKATGNGDIAKRQTDTLRSALDYESEQHPIGTTVGKMGTQAAMYALTNPAFDALGAKLGATTVAGKVLANQIGQNAQDIALDTIPTALNMQTQHGTLTDEDKKQLAKDAAVNAVQNLAMQGIGAGIDYLKNKKTGNIDLKQADVNSLADSMIADNAELTDDALKTATANDVNFVEPEPEDINISKGRKAKSDNFLNSKAKMYEDGVTADATGNIDFLNNTVKNTETPELGADGLPRDFGDTTPEVDDWRNYFADDVNKVNAPDNKVMNENVQRDPISILSEGRSDYTPRDFGEDNTFTIDDDGHAHFAGDGTRRMGEPNVYSNRAMGIEEGDPIHITNDVENSYTKTSKSKHTFENSGIYSVEDFGDGSVHQYAKHSEVANMNEAADYINNDWDGALKKYTKTDVGDKDGTFYSPSDIDGMFMAADKLKKMANMTDDPALKAKYRAQMMQIQVNIAKTTRSGGRIVQAMAKWTRTADGAITVAQGMAQEQIEKAFKKSPEMQKQVDNVLEQIKDGVKDIDVDADTIQNQVIQIVREAVNGNNIVKERLPEEAIKEISEEVLNNHQWGDIERTLERYTAKISLISPETEDSVRELFEEAQKYHYNSRQRCDLENQAYALLANDLNVGRTFGDKVNTWRYFAMLGNPRTHIVNLAGNAGFRGLNNISDAVSITTQQVLQKLTNGNYQAEKAFLSRKDKPLKKAVSEYAETHAYRELAGNKWISSENAINRAGKAFTSKNKILNALMAPIQKGSEVNGKALDIEDYAFTKSMFVKSLSERLKQAGVDASILQSTNPKDIEFLRPLVEKSISDAKYSTFHEGHNIANFLSHASEELKNANPELNGSFAAKLTHLAIESLFPFKGTPLNVVDAVIDYSPIKVAQSFGDLVVSGNNMLGRKLGTVGKYDATHIIDGLSKGLTGSGLMALGYYLGKNGIIRGSSNESNAKRYYDESRGKQEYSLNFKVGDTTHSYSLANLAPAALPLLVGAQISEGAMDADSLINGLMRIGNPVMDTTMLSGLNDSIEAIGQEASSNGNNGGNGLTAFAQQTAINYAGQFVPTVLGQVARTVDETRRATYTDQTGYKKYLDKFKTKTENKIPGLSMTNPAYVDVWGRTQYNTGGENILARAVQNFLSPGYYQQGRDTEVDKALDKLYDSVPDDAIVAQTSSGRITYKTADGVDKNIRLDPKTYEKYQTTRGQTAYKLLDSLTTSKGYDQMTDEQKANAVKSLFKVADHAAGYDTISDYNVKSNNYDLYKEKGVEGIVQDIEAQSVLTGMGLENSAKNKALYADGKMDVLKEKSAISQKLTDNSVDVTETNINALMGKSEKMQDWYVQNYSKVASAKTGNITEDSIISYLAKNPKDINYVNEIWGDSYKNLSSKAQKVVDANKALGSGGYNQLVRFESAVKGGTKSIDYLKNRNMSDANKGYLLSTKVPDNDSIASTFAKAKSYDSLYKYELYKKEADADGNGSLKRDEVKNYLDSLGMSAQDKSKWASVLLSNSTKNPYTGVKGGKSAAIDALK